ncbi:MAG: DUF4123 domain-containing protein [Pseudomonadota bacterium]
MLTSQSIRDVLAAHAAKHPNEFFYLLIDHAGMPGLLRELRKTRFEWASLFEGTTQANALSVAPILIRVGSTSEAIPHGFFLRWVCERGAYRSSLTLLVSALTIRELAGRLTARLDAKISDETEVLLRYFDPRVFEQLVLSLSIDQRTALLSVASSWWFVDRIGELRAVESQFSMTDAHCAPLILSARQEFALVDASEPDQVAEQLRKSVPNEFNRLSGAERYPFITRHMRDGRDFRITSTRELALYCALALLYGADFSTGPEWATKLDLIRESKHDLTSVVARLSESPADEESHET